MSDKVSSPGPGTVSDTAVPERAFAQLLGQLAEAPPAPRDPERVGHFRLIERLGEGGMGTVFKAEDERLGRLVAVKVVSRRASRDESARARLVREARAASALSHPNIVTIFSIETSADGEFIVMELVEGEPLDRVIQRGPLPVAQAVRIAAELCDGLAAAHAAGLVHRDIKPSNIVITKRGAPKILDFGIVQAAGSVDPTGATAALLTAEGALVGTVPYMSPEQLRGRAVDGRTDVFALGCVLFEMVTGRRAFVGHELPALIEQITQHALVAPSSIHPAVPLALDSIVARAVAREPADRFTAAELGEALRAHAAEGRGVEAPASTADRPLVGRDRERGVLDAVLQRAASGVGGLALVLGDPGMGKTELVDHVIRRERSRSIVGLGRCVEQFGAREAYAPLFDLLEDLLAGGHAAAVRQILVELAPTWALRLHVASLATRGALELDAFGATKDRMVRELADALAEISTLAPLVLVIEDAQWAEASTVDALQALAARLERRRATLIVTARATELEKADSPARAMVTSWRARARHAELRLEALSEADVAALLAARFVPNDFDGSVAAALHARAEGHPLFLVGMVELLCAQGVVRREDGRWRAPRIDPAALQLPDNLQGMLQAKLAALPADDLALLEQASLQGIEFVSSVLADVAGLDELAIDRRLEELARTSGLVRTAGEEELPDGSLASRWRFAHALYRHAVYARLPARRRAALHADVAAALVRRHRGATAAIAGVLASHYEGARDHGAAIAHHLQAGDNAMALLAAEDAARHYAAALACVERVAGREQEAIAVLRQCALAAQAAGRPEPAIEYLRDALARARRLDSPALVGTAHLALADALITGHQLAAARPHLDAARTLAERAGLEDLRHDALAMYALDRMLVGELEACRAALDAIPSPGPLSLYVRGLTQFFAGEYEASVRTLQDELEPHDAARGDALLLMEARMVRGLALANGGHLGQALRLLEATLQQARRNDNVAMTARLENSIGWVYRELGMLDRALAHDERAIQAGRATGESEAEANALVNLSEDRLAGGDVARATDSFGRVRELAAADEWARWRYGLRLQAAQARAALSAGDRGAAAAAIDALLARAEAYFAGKYIVVGHELAARLAVADGDRTAAWAAIEAARSQLARTPTPVVAWRLEVLAAEIADADGRARDAQSARDAARAIVYRIARDLTPEQRETFVAQPAMRALHVARP